MNGAVRRATDIATGAVGVLAVGVVTLLLLTLVQPSRAEQVANANEVAIVWVDELACAGVEALGCFDIRQPNQITVVRGLEGSQQEYVILHELGHAVFYRFGKQSTECEADSFAHAMGASANWSDC